MKKKKLIFVIHKGEVNFENMEILNPKTKEKMKNVPVTLFVASTYGHEQEITDHIAAKQYRKDLLEGLDENNLTAYDIAMALVRIVKEEEGRLN